MRRSVSYHHYPSTSDPFPASFAIFHPIHRRQRGRHDQKPGTWNSGTYRLETTLIHAPECAWCFAERQQNDVAFGYDEGLVAMKLGRDVPSLSMDRPGTHLFSQHGRPISESTGRAMHSCFAGRLRSTRLLSNTRSTDDSSLPLVIAPRLRLCPC